MKHQGGGVECSRATERSEAENTHVTYMIYCVSDERKRTPSEREQSTKSSNSWLIFCTLTFSMNLMSEFRVALVAVVGTACLTEKLEEEGAGGEEGGGLQTGQVDIKAWIRV